MDLFRWGLCLTYAGCFVFLFYYAYFSVSLPKINVHIPSATCSQALVKKVSQCILGSGISSAKFVYHALLDTFSAVESVSVMKFPNRTTSVDIMLEPIAARINNSQLLWGNSIVDDCLFQQVGCDTPLNLRVSSIFLAQTKAVGVLHNLVEAVDSNICFGYSIFVEHELSVYLASLKRPGLVIHATIESFPASSLCILCEQIFNELNLNGSFERAHINLVFDMRFSGGLVVSQVEGGQWQVLSLDSKSM